jgi:16S rRNA (adenine1518-N6/adenine1519-N6)-dimethyltransferase
MSSYHAKKRLGQNFLVSPEIISRIIEAIAPKSSETIIEVGAGKGALTLPLTKSGAKVIAVEYDKDLIGYLTALLRGNDNVALVHSDFLLYEPTELDRFVLVGNLPYNITSPVLAWACQYHAQVSRAILMMQKEVAVRLSAAPCSKGWSPLSLFTQLYFNIELLFHVQREEFHPRPDVTSSVVRLLPAKAPSIPNFSFFEKVVRAAFVQRRKLLVTNLSSEFSVDTNELRDIIANMDIEPTARAEELSTEQFITLADLLYHSGLLAENKREDS